MYSITCKNIFEDGIGSLLYSDKSDIDETKVFNPSLSLSTNSAGSLQLAIPPCNYCYDIIEHINTELIVFRNDTGSVLQEIWRGRVLSEDIDFYNNRTIVCEGELAYFNDTIQPPNVYRESTVKAFLTKILAVHNNQVGNEKKFYVGEVTVESEESLTYQSTEFEDTMSCLQSQFLDQYGGFFRIRRVNGVRYLDYLSSSPAVSKQEIRFGLNILDISKHFDMSEFATAVIPLGTVLEDDTYDYIFNNEGEAYYDPDFKKAMIKSDMGDKFDRHIPVVYNDLEFAKPLIIDTTGDVGKVTIARKGDNNKAVLSQITSKEDYYPEFDDHLTIESVNEGKIDLIDSTAVGLYGYICKVINFDDVTDPELLMEAGQLYLSQIQYDNMEIEVSAFDLHYADPETDSINLFDGVHVVSLDHVLDRIFYVVSMELPINDPSNAKISLSGTIAGSTGSISDITSGNTKATKSILGVKAYKANKK